MKLATPLAEQAGLSTAERVDDARIGKPQRILVLGGGPSGLLTLHELLNPRNRPIGESVNKKHIQLYERREEVGGVWYFEPDNEDAKRWRRTDSASDLGQVKQQDANQDVPRWPSPAYQGLVGNVLPPLLECSAVPFAKPSEGLFPSLVETYQYLLEVAKPLAAHIKTKQEVVAVRPSVHPGETAVRWLVTSTDWAAKPPSTSTEEWNAVVIASGAYDHPYYPEVTGLAPLLETRSPLVMHAKSYPGPRAFAGQENRIVIVGNANSANDIAAHLAPLNTGPIYRCVRHPSYFAHLSDERIKDVESIGRIDQSEDGSTLSLTLTDGTRIDGVTKLIFASGYEFSFDWIQVPSTSGSLGLQSASKNGAVPNLYNGTLLATAPTLAFVGLSACSSPMPLAEIQGRVVSRLFHNILDLPDTPALLDDFKQRYKSLGLSDDDPGPWRQIHMIRGEEERRLTQALLDQLEDSEPGCSTDLFHWDSRRESVVSTMRAVKESELKRRRDERIVNAPDGLSTTTA